MLLQRKEVSGVLFLNPQLRDREGLSLRREVSRG